MSRLSVFGIKRCLTVSSQETLDVSVLFMILFRPALSTYRAVCEVLGGSPIGEVAVRYGTTRQSLDSWRARFKQERMAGLADRSPRPHSSPTKLSAEVEALICRMRREHPRWGARRISYELGSHGLERAPSRATVHRVLTRNGLVDPQAQQHKLKYKRWQRQAPIHLWHLDILGGLPFANGRGCKLLTATSSAAARGPRHCHSHRRAPQRLQIRVADYACRSPCETR
jgi:transposase